MLAGYHKADSGKTPVVLKNVGASELIRRVTSTDEDLRMPPEGDPLSSAQIELLRQWINHGAPWPDKKEREGATSQSLHWSFQINGNIRVWDIVSCII